MNKLFKNRFKKLTAVLCTVFMLVPNLAFAADGKNTADNTKTATAVLGKTLVNNGFETVEVGRVSGQVNTSKDGRQAWLLDKSQGTNKASIYFVLSNAVKHTQKDGSVYEIEVDYYDSGNGYVRLFYDSYTNEKRTAATAYTNKENKWKTLKVTLDDAAFTKRCNGKCDFSVSIEVQSIETAVSPESIAVSEVRVKRYEAKNPIFVTSTNDETGNAFKWFSESKIIHNNIENLTDEKQNVAVTYTAMSDSYVKVFEKTENYTFEPREERNVDVDLGEVDQCGIYKWYVDVKSDDGKINSHTQPFEFSIIKTDPNGIKNDTYFAAHISRYPTEQRKMGVEMLKNANSSGARESFGWEYYEVQPGVFSTENMSDAIILGYLLEKDLHYLAYFSATSSKHGMVDWKDHPDSQEDFDAFRIYVRNAAKEVDGKVDGIEIFNEPNITSFNRHVEQGADYAAKMYVEALKIAYEEIKKVNPNLKVGGPVLCFINNEKGKDFFNAAMKYGMWKYLDALDLHPYANNYVEKTGLQPHIEWYREEFKKVGKPNIEFWYSEMGYTTADKGIDTSYRQGYLNAASVMFYKSKNFGDKFVFYNLEQKGTTKTAREDCFGHTSPGYVESSVYGKWFVPNPSYLIVTAMNYFMAQTKTVNSFYVDNNNISINLFKSEKFNKNLLTMYSMVDHKNITIDLGTNNITYADEWGNETQMSSPDGIYTFTLDKAPVYVLGDITKTDVLNTQSGAEINGYDINVATDDGYTMELTTQDNKNYAIEIDAPDCVKDVKVTDFNNGKAYISFKSTAKPGESYKINVYLTADGNKMQYSGVNVKSVESAQISSKVSLISENNLNRWQTVFNIKNYSQTHNATGKIRITSPSNLKTDFTDIGLIPSGTTGQVKLNLPEIRKKGEYNIDYELLLDNGNKITSSDKIDFTLAKYASVKPTIDGKAQNNEWTNDTFMYAENDYQIKQIKDWKGKNDLSAKACIEWDEDNLYLLCEVTDDIFNQPEPANTGYKGDSVQIGIFYGDEVQVALGQKNISFHELCLSKTPDGDAVYRFLSQDNCYEAGDITKDCEIAVTREGDKTVYEFKMPWDKLLMPGQKPKLNDKLGFSFLVNDNDGNGRRGWIEYASGIGDSKNTQLFTYLTLIN